MSHRNSSAIVAFLALSLGSVVASGAPKATTVDIPILSFGQIGSSSMDVIVTGGPTAGEPAGFTLQWMTSADLQANNNVWPSSDNTAIPSFCAGSFSGNAFASNYSLGPNQSVTVRVGDLLLDNGASVTGNGTDCSGPLKCNTSYVFRAFGHATSTLGKSGWSPTASNTTAGCSNNAGCTYTQGYWKTHGPDPSGQNVDVWPIVGTSQLLNLGSNAYYDTQLQAIFVTPVAGNGLISLAHQLTAAKLNIRSGSDPSAINATLSSADALIGNLWVPPIGVGFLTPSQTSSLTTTLDNYNTGLIGPGHCDSETGQQ